MNQSAQLRTETDLYGLKISDYLQHWTTYCKTLVYDQIDSAPGHLYPLAPEKKSWTA
jgi:hypothetical protein